MCHPFLQSLDRQRRCVRGQHGRRPRPRFQLAEDGSLGLQVFQRRLDDDIDVVEALPFQRALDGGQALDRFRLGQQPALDRLAKQSLDAFQPGIEGRLADFLHDDLAALERGQLRDARAHRPGADDAHAAHFGRRRAAQFFG